MPVYINNFVSLGYQYPALARFIVPVGSHQLSACVTSPTGAGNDVHIYGFGLPDPNAVSPQVLIGGDIHVQDDPNDVIAPFTAIGNALNQQIANQLASDGLNAVFVNIRAFVDPHLGMLSNPDANCNGAQNPPHHVNNCGTFQLEHAFWEAINGVFVPQ